jgi:hypothetical protein
MIMGLAGLPEDLSVLVPPGDCTEAWLPTVTTPERITATKPATNLFVLARLIICSYFDVDDDWSHYTSIYS